MWDGVTSAVGSDATKRDDRDALVSFAAFGVSGPRSDDAVFEWALDAPNGSAEWFSAKGKRGAIGPR